MGLVYVRWDGEARQSEGYVANLSQNGAGLYVTEPLQEGQRIDLVMVGGPRRSRRDAPLSAWVVWCKPLGGLHQAGVRFAALGDHRYREILLAYGCELDEWLGASSIEPGDAEKALHEVIDKRLLTAVFQPIVDLRSGEVLGYEGLARFS